MDHTFNDNNNFLEFLSLLTYLPRYIATHHHHVFIQQCWYFTLWSLFCWLVLSVSVGTKRVASINPPTHNRRKNSGKNRRN